MNSKILISFLYAFALTAWPPDKGISQVKEIPDSINVEGFDSAVFYDLQDAKAEFKVVAGTTKNIQKEAISNLIKLEKRHKVVRVDTIYLPIYDTVVVDSPKHKKSLFHRIFR